MISAPSTDAPQNSRDCQADRRYRRGERLSSQAGFTLVEMLVVLAIIGMVMSLVGPRVMNYLTDSKVKAAKIQVESLSSAIELFYLDTGRYPLESEGLVALAKPPSSLSTWNGPYLKSGIVPLDPWGQPYRYKSDRGRNYVVSYVSPDARDVSEVPKRQSRLMP